VKPVAAPSASASRDPGVEAVVDAVLRRLSVGEKCRLTSGTDTWHAAGVEAAGVPPLKVTDGPNGARGATFGQVTSACFPCGTALGATWDPALVEEVGAAIGREARRKGAQVLLAPTVNIQRHPLAGRNFECPSEDPCLTAAYAAAYVTGVQSEGVAATVKHFVCNDSEFERMTISSEVGERALREIYLPPFEAAVRAGSWALMSAYNRVNGVYAAEHPLLRDLLKGQWGFDGLVMSDWWGTHSTEASALAGLDLEMPGPRIYLSDRLETAVASGAVPEDALDEMVRRRLRLAVRVGSLDSSVAAGASAVDEQAVDDPDDRALIRRAAASAMVLLANGSGVLPLPSDGAGEAGSVAVVGPFADTLAVQGGGSARVEPHHQVSVLAALSERLTGRVVFERGCGSHRGMPTLECGPPAADPGAAADGVPEGRGALLEYFTGDELAGAPVWRERRGRLELTWLGDPAPAAMTGPFSVRVRGTLVPDESGTHTFGLTSAGRSRLRVDGELVVDNWTAQTPGSSFRGLGSTRVTGDVFLEAGRPAQIEVEFASPTELVVSGVTVGCRRPTSDDLLDRAVAAAAAAETAVVVVGTGHEWETEGRDRESMALPSKQDELVARVAAANARTVVVLMTAGPVTMPWADDVAAIVQAWFPGQEGGDAVADVLLGAVDPGGRLPVTVPFAQSDCPADLTYPGEAGSVSYGEGVFVGYRGYRRRGVAPRFCFGHGLSYASFSYGPVRVEPAVVRQDDDVVVRVAVTNAGERPGSEVVQVYVSDDEHTLLRPDRELKGFVKVSLAPGQQREVSVVLGPRAFAAWDPRVHDGVAEPGSFTVLVGSSSEDIRGETTVELLDRD
jgi:beta-glucosidase